MSFLGLEVSKASPNYRIKRFTAFAIDVVIVLSMLYIVFKTTGKPDFPSVKAAMDAAKKGSTGANAQALADNMFSLFDRAYLQSLCIWLAYEIITQIVFRGATAGKLIMGLRIASMNSKRSWFIHDLLMTARSAIKFVFLYLFQGFPFLIAVLTIFSNKQSRAGYDIFTGTYVKDLREGSV